MCVDVMVCNTSVIFLRHSVVCDVVVINVLLQTIMKPWIVLMLLVLWTCTHHTKWYVFVSAAHYISL